MMKRTSCFLLASCLLACAAQDVPSETPAPAATAATQPEPAQPGPIVLRDVGLATPESVLHDVESDVYLVSNIHGAPADKDDNGFISRISPDGQVLELKWIDGEQRDVTLHAPKGMAIAGGVVYVSDIDVVRKFDAKTGAPKGEIEIKGAVFLNDVAAAADGTIYVSDTSLTPKFESSGKDAVYAITGDKATTLIKHKDLKGPNGLLTDDTGVWVVTFGGNELYNVKSGKKTDVKTLPKGQLDGVAKTTDGKLLVSSWESGEVLRGGAAEDFVPLVANVKSPADIGYDSKRNRVLVPLFTENALHLQPL